MEGPICCLNRVQAFKVKEERHKGMGKKDKDRCGICKYYVHEHMPAPLCAESQASILNKAKLGTKKDFLSHMDLCSTCRHAIYEHKATDAN